MATEHEKTNQLIENLATAVVNGFQRIDERFDQLEDRIDGLETRIDGIDARTGQTEQSLKSFKEEVRERFDHIDDRIDEVEENVMGIVRDYHPRIEALETSVFGESTFR